MLSEIISLKQLLLMDKFSRLELDSHHPISEAFKALNIYNFNAACDYIEQLPYKRISNRNDYTLVLTEKCGTCSSKHALLKALAKENNLDEVNLCIGIYKMNALNTKGIGSVLEDFKLQYIPEAHSFLRVNSDIIDITGLGNSDTNFENDLLHEELIEPYQVGQYKEELHKAYLKQWIIEEGIPLPLDTIWNIREQCIANLTV